jgi:putative Ca2+/H+ antiporter (TMEM165/GDT1 family)
VKKQHALKIVNGCLFLAFLCTVVAVLLYRWGPDALQGTETVYQVHTTAGLIFVVLAIVHVILNFNWILTTYFKKKK